MTYNTRFTAAPRAHVGEFHREQPVEGGRTGDHLEFVNHELEGAHHEDQVRVALHLEHVFHVGSVTEEETSLVNKNFQNLLCHSRSRHHGDLRWRWLWRTKRGLKQRPLHSLQVGHPEALLSPGN